MADDSSTHHVIFSYGTLKRGERNDSHMGPEWGRAEFLGCGETKGKYPLVLDALQDIAYLMKVEGQGYNVRGELYKVDDKMLKHLDDFEEHPNWYLRQEVEITLTQDKDGNDVTTAGQTMTCWVYFLAKPDEEKLRLKYVPEYKSGAPCQNDSTQE